MNLVNFKSFQRIGSKIICNKILIKEKLNLHFVAPKPNIGILNKEQQKLIKDVQEKHKHCLRIPRRPVWKNEDYDAKTLQLKERESFLEWRRGLAEYVSNNLN